MSSFRTLIATALLFAAASTPVFAQAAIQEPGSFAFFHPNADVLNGGRPTGGGAFAAVPRGGWDYDDAAINGGYVAAPYPRHRVPHPRTHYR